MTSNCTCHQDGEYFINVASYAVLELEFREGQ